MPTPHNSAHRGDIAKVVLMPGDPLRAELLANRYLKDPVQFNAVRGMLGFTGMYEGVPVSVMGSGMGIPSIAIYSWELYNEYDVQSIIRIGSAGGLAPAVKLRDVLICQGACTDSNYALGFGLPGTFAPIADFGLMREAVRAAERLKVPYHVGNIVSTDTFYCDPQVHKAWAAMGVLGAEMEAAGLYLNAAKVGKKALGIMTVSDLPLAKESLSAEDRQTSFTQMMEVALAVAVSEYSTS